MHNNESSPVLGAHFSTVSCLLTSVTEKPKPLRNETLQALWLAKIILYFPDHAG